MQKDARLLAVKPCFEAGVIKKFSDIFKYVPKTIVYQAIFVKYVRFSRAIHRPEKFRLEDLRRMAELFEIDTRALIALATDEMLNEKINSNA